MLGGGPWHPSQIKMQCVELITHFIVVLVLFVDVAARHIKLYFDWAQASHLKAVYLYFNPFPLPCPSALQPQGRVQCLSLLNPELDIYELCLHHVTWLLSCLVSRPCAKFFLIIPPYTAPASNSPPHSLPLSLPFSLCSICFSSFFFVFAIVKHFL